MKKNYILVTIFSILFTERAFCMEGGEIIDEDAVRSVFTEALSDEHFKNIEDEPLTSIINSPFTLNLFQEIVAKFCISRGLYLLDAKMWMSGENPFSRAYRSIFSKHRTHFESNEIFYAQKLFVKNKTKFIFFSDIHANKCVLNSLIKDMIKREYMDSQLKLRKDCILIGLGDYMDRQERGLNLLTILLLIALKNPKKVILLRGNHEDIPINKKWDLLHDIRSSFVTSSGAKITESETEALLPQVCALLTKVYELMPSVLYLSQVFESNKVNDYLICSHGLLDFKFNPADFLDFDNEKLRTKLGSRACVIHKNIFKGEDMLDDTSEGVGFLWHDLGIGNLGIVEEGEANRIRYEPTFVANFCRRHCSKQNKISGMIGGHDHSFAKTTLGVDRTDFTPATGFAVISDIDEALSFGVLNDKEQGYAFQDVFSFVKFTSSPNGCAYIPTYLVVTKSQNPGPDLLWHYKVIECGFYS